MRKASENKTTKKQVEKNLVSTASKPLETKKVEEKAVETKTEVKPETKDEKKVVEPKKTEPKKEKTVRTTAKKETVKKEPKTPRKKSEAAAKLTLQVDGRDDLAIDSLVERVKAAYVAEGHKAASIKDIEVYIKLSENMAYYVIDGYASGISLY